jgi:signal transduction histidine kinase
MQRWKLKKFLELFSWRRIGCCAVLLPVCFFSTLQKSQAAGPVSPAPADWLFEATNHLGRWIWDTNSFDKQTVRFWRAFEIPAGVKVSRALLSLTVDNGYTLFLDGAEIGRGSDWRTISEYDLTQLLGPGRHVLGVEAFNDRLEGGLILGMEIELPGRPPLRIVSDPSWKIISNAGPGKHRAEWPEKELPGWRAAVVVGVFQTPPWIDWPRGLAIVPPLPPVIIHFWQRGWFQLSLFTVCLLALLFSLWLATQLASQAKAQKFLHVERIRIARDIHDDLGAQLTQLLLLGEVAQREQPEDSLARGQFTQICDRARELAHAMDEVVWAVNARRDTIRDFTSYVCKYAQIYLSATSIKCRLDVEAEIPATTFDLPVRRNLFLAVKEALNNAAKHSQADELFLRIFRRDHKLSVAVEDNGRGFDPAQTGGERNGLTNMEQRMAEIGGVCEVSSQPGGGCLVVFTVPLPPERRRWFRRKTEAAAEAAPADFSQPRL